MALGLVQSGRTPCEGSMEQRLFFTSYWIKIREKRLQEVASMSCMPRTAAPHDLLPSSRPTPLNTISVL